MALLYYGTNISEGIKIANRGAILSELEEQREGLLRYFSNRDANKVAYQLLSRRKPSYEMTRADHVILCTTWERARTQSIITIPVGFVKECLVLGLNLEDSLVSTLHPDGDGETRVIPKRVSIDGLAEIHVFDSEPNQRLVRALFSKPGIKYFDGSETQEEKQVVSLRLQPNLLL